MSRRPYEDRHFRPFQDLDRLLKRNKVALKSAAPRRAAQAAAPALSPQQEERLFREAMADVAPLDFNLHWQWPKRRLSFASIENDEERQAVEDLSRLIEEGEGFIVAHTAEYMEATAPGVSSQIARQLHSGRYAVQDHVDLHGLTVREAEAVLHAFIRRALQEGKRAVLVIHGRGLTSPGPPVLKQSVFAWLTRGVLRKHIIALTSARSCDGGAGATYVLLRRHPWTSRARRKAGRTP